MALDKFKEDKKKAKDNLDAKFHPKHFPSIPKQCLFEKNFPEPGDLAVFRVVYTNELVAECELLEYVDQVRFLLSCEEAVDDVLSAGDVRVAFVRHSNQVTGI